MLPILIFAAVQAASATPLATPATPAASDALPADWVAIPDDQILVMTLAGGGTVVMRLAAAQTPRHVANIRKLAKAKWWDTGGSVYRVQDNYVAQWGDVTEKKPLPADVEANPPAEYEWQGAAPVAKLTRRDPYAEWGGYTRDGWPLAGSGTFQWLPHCYGMVGVARDLAPSTGSGGDLYAVIGHGPRALDRNIAIVGRVVEGIERLSALPRGTGDLGFYKAPAETPVAIMSVRLASDLPAAERPHFQYRATDNFRFAAWIRARENRQPPFFVVPAGGADICNALPPVRRAPAASGVTSGAAH